MSAAPAAAHRATLGDNTFGANLRRILPLAWPVLIGQLAVIAFSTIDTVLVGRQSPQDLAAFAVGSATYITVFVGLMGVVLAVSVIVGQLQGARRYADAGRALHQSVWVALGLSVLGCAVLLFPGPFLALAQLDGEVEPRLRSYLAALAFALPAALLFTCYRGFNTAVSRPKAVMVIQLGSLAIKLPLSALLVFGATLPVPVGNSITIPSLGVTGCGVSTAIVMWLQVLVGWIALRRSAFYQPYAIGGRGLDRPDTQALWSQLKLGIPMGLSILIEVTGFTFMAIFIARLGTTAVAGHQLAANLVALCFMVPLALSNATSTLVAQSVGAGDFAGARRLGWHGVIAALASGSLVALVLVMARESIAGLYTRDAAVVAAALPLLAWAAAFHLADAVQAMAAFVLRAWRIATVPMLIYVGALWGVGLGGGMLLAFDDTGSVPAWLRGAQGFWLAATAGLVAAAIALVAFLWWTMRRGVDGSGRLLRPSEVRPWWQRAALGAAWAISASALVLSLVPSVPMPSGPFGDKVVHAGGYATLAACWYLALKGAWPRWLALAAWLGVSSFGALIEGLQALTPWRRFDWWDMLANGLGAGLGVMIAIAAVGVMGLLTRRPAESVPHR